MNLEQVTKRQIELIPLLNDANKKYAEILYEVELKKAWFYRLEETMGYKNADVREAHLSAVLEKEGMLKMKQDASNDYYRLKTERDLLVEVGKSLRTLGQRATGTEKEAYYS